MSLLLKIGFLFYEDFLIFKNNELATQAKLPKASLLHCKHLTRKQITSLSGQKIVYGLKYENLIKIINKI